MSLIHPSAIVSEEAKIGNNVEIGPFSIIDAGCIIGDNTRIGGQAWITNRSEIGHDNMIGYGSIIGGNPQDTSFDESILSHVKIGNHNTIREYVTIHRSTSEGEYTHIGDKNFFMTGVHIAHDVNLGNENIFANNVLLAGHVTVGDKTFLGGGAGFHQFINIGDYAIVKGNGAISCDVPPYTLAHGSNIMSGLNSIGMRRGGISAETRKEIKFLHNLLFQSGLNLSQAIKEAENNHWSPEALKLLNAARNPSKKGMVSR